MDRGLLGDSVTPQIAAGVFRVRSYALDVVPHASHERNGRSWPSWSNDPAVIRPGSVDLLLSQAVMEHVDDLPGTHRAVHDWLKLGGYMSHTIDYRPHGTASGWNGHWAHSDFSWKLVRGRLPYLLNRSTGSRTRPACGCRLTG